MHSAGPALIALLTLLLSVACAKSSRDSKPSAAAAAPSASVTPDLSSPGPRVERFGAAVSASAGEPVAQILRSPERYESKDVVVTGYVRRACSRKGCWMELAERADAKLPGCRVTFKDYGFFVPTDSAGSRARVQAALAVTNVPARSVEHLEQEGATFPSKAADGSAREVRLVATGVELYR
jgi:hypothetical protein